MPMKPILKNILDAQLQSLLDRLSADFCALSIYDPINLELRWKLARGSLNDRYKKIVIRNDKGLCAKALQMKREFVISNFPEELLEDSIEYPILLLEQLKSVIVAPLVHDSMLIGIILVGSRVQRDFMPTEVEKTIESATEILETYLNGERDETEFQSEVVILSEFLKKERIAQGDRFDVIILDQRIIHLPYSTQTTLVSVMQRLIGNIFEQNIQKLTCVCESFDDSAYTIQLTTSQYYELDSETFSLLAEEARSINGSIEMTCEKEKTSISLKFLINK